MDKRETFDSLQKLKAILVGLQKEQTKASFLLDSDGLTRMEGVVTFIEEEPAATVITLNGTVQLVLNQIIAVNGVFRSDYSEC